MCTQWLEPCTLQRRGGGLGSRPKKIYGERLGDGVEYHFMKTTPRRWVPFTTGRRFHEISWKWVSTPAPHLSCKAPSPLCTNTCTHVHICAESHIQRQTPEPDTLTTKDRHRKSPPTHTGVCVCMCVCVMAACIAKERQKESKDLMLQSFLVKEGQHHGIRESRDRERDTDTHT